MPLILESSIALNLYPPEEEETNVSVGSGNTTSGPCTYLLLPFSSFRIQYSRRSRVTASRT